MMIHHPFSQITAVKVPSCWRGRGIGNTSYLQTSHWEGLIHLSARKPSHSVFIFIAPLIDNSSSGFKPSTAHNELLRNAKRSIWHAASVAKEWPILFLETLLGDLTGHIRSVFDDKFNVFCSFEAWIAGCLAHLGYIGCLFSCLTDKHRLHALVSSDEIS
jgi:hypothetical protein